MSLIGSSELTDLYKDILDALSDGYYSVSIITGLLADDDKGDPTEYEILERLETLHSGNFVFLLINKTFHKAKIIEEFEGKVDTNDLLVRANRKRI